MKKMVIVVIGIICIVGVGCSSSKINVSQKKVTKHCAVNQFKSIVVNGSAMVELVNGAYGIDVTGVQAGSYSCEKNVVNKVLHLGGNLIIKVSAPELEKITVTDDATVSGKKFKTNKLVVVAKNNGAINLEGRMNVHGVSQHGSGRINIDWVDADFIRVEGSGDGPIYLAGVAKKALIRLTKKATLNARYLRTEKSSVYTADKSLAEVWADNLDASAVDNSNIYYYKMPKDLNVTTSDAANVLHPDWIR